MILSPRGNRNWSLLSSLQIQEQFCTLKSGSALPYLSTTENVIFQGKQISDSPESRFSKPATGRYQSYFFSALCFLFTRLLVLSHKRSACPPPFQLSIAKPLTWTTCTSALKLQSSVVLSEATVCMGPLCREMGHYLCVRSDFCTIPGNHRIRGAPSAEAPPQQQVQEDFPRGMGNKHQQ